MLFPGLDTTASITASLGASFPFQSHSRMPPISLTGAGRFLGQARSSASTSIRLLLPLPFGPMNTFNPCIGRSIPVRPKDSSPATFKCLISMASEYQGRRGGRTLILPLAVAGSSKKRIRSPNRYDSEMPQMPHAEKRVHP